VDGFRCDYAKGLPVEVWEEINAALLSVNPELFLLAESEQGEMQLAAFHATYGWELMHIFDAIAQGRAPATAIDGVLAARSLVLPKGAREMLMTSNHDENTWLGTDLERFGGGHQAFAVLTMTMDGIPLIYNGQEAGLDKRLEFFEKDPIDWRPSPMADFYRELVRLRSQHPALHVGAPTTRVATTDDARIYAFKRTAADGSEVLVICNLTAKDVEFHLGGEGIAGEWKDLFSGETVELEATTQMELRSWKYHVLSR
jgi:glycosidase